MNDFPEYYIKIFESALVVLILILLRILILRVVNRHTKDQEVQYKWRKNLVYGLTFIGFIVVGRIWFEGFGSLATFLGLVSAGLVIALREPFLDVVGCLYLLWRKPIKVGDRIEIGKHLGDVIDTRLFKFTILEIGNWVHADHSTGRVIHISNHKIFSESIANYTSDFDFIWNEIEVIITFDSDWRKAKKILENIAHEHLDDFVNDADKQIKKASNLYLIRYNYLTPYVYLEVDDKRGIKLSLRHLTSPRKRRSTSMLLWEDILEEFQKESNITFTFPTYRIYQNTNKT